MGLWLAPNPLVLASRSRARQALLAGAGVPFTVRPADLDERALADRAPSPAADAVAAFLAREKALAVASSEPGRLVLGADQTLALGGERFDKPADRAAAVSQLRALRGRTHTLYSAVAAVQDGAVVSAHVETARLTMRLFSDRFLESYLDGVGEAATASVGGYQIEGAGLQLFERIEGEYFTILGLPLLPVLDFLRRHRCLAS
jgi:septum formation protein